MKEKKYHVNFNGIVGECNAQDGNCPFGGKNQHFPTIEQAQEYADIINERESYKNKMVTKRSLQELFSEMHKDRTRKNNFVDTCGKTLCGVNRVVKTGCGFPSC